MIRLIFVFILTVSVWPNLNAQYVSIETDSLTLFGNTDAASKLCEQFVRLVNDPTNKKYFSKKYPEFNTPFYWVNKHKHLKLYFRLKGSALILDSAVVDTTASKELRKQLYIFIDRVMSSLNNRHALFANLDLNFEYGDSTLIGFASAGIDIFKPLYLHEYSVSLSIKKGTLVLKKYWKNTTSDFVKSYTPFGLVVFGKSKSIEHIYSSNPECIDLGLGYRFEIDLSKKSIVDSIYTLGKSINPICLAVTNSYLKDFNTFPRVMYRGSLVLEKANCDLFFERLNGNLRYPAFYMRYKMPKFSLRNIHAIQKTRP